MWNIERWFKANRPFGKRATISIQPQSALARDDDYYHSQHEITDIENDIIEESDSDENPHKISSGNLLPGNNTVDADSNTTFQMFSEIIPPESSGLLNIQTRGGEYDAIDDDDEEKLRKKKKDAKRGGKSFFQECAGKVPYYIPVLRWLPRYQWRKNFSQDFVAGLGVAFMIIPQGLAFAKLAGLEPVYGLYTAWISTLVYGIFGTCGQFSIGPDALASLLVGLEAAHISQEVGVDPAVIAPVFALFSGLILFFTGLFRFGFLDNVLSQPLLSGFVNAVGIIIIIDQVDTLLGIKINPGEVDGYGIYKLPFIYSHADKVHYPTLAVALGTVIILSVFRVVKTLSNVTALKFIPETMLVVVMGTALVGFLRLDLHGISIMGKIPTQFIAPQLPQITSWEMAQKVIPSAVLIAVIGFTESLIVAKMHLSRQNTEYSPNRELVAVGIANVVGSFFHTWPTFASLPRSSLAKFMGAQTQIFGFIVSCILLLCIVVLAQFFYYLPRAVLSGIVVVAAVSLLETHDVLFLMKIQAWVEVLLSVAIFILTLLVGVDYGILISIGISIFMVIKHSSLPHISLLGLVPDTRDFRDVKTTESAASQPGVVVLKIEESLYFANIQQIKKILSRMENVGDMTAHPSQERDKSVVPLKAIIIHSRYIPTMDGSAVQVLVEMMKTYAARGIFMCFVKLRGSIKKYFLRCGVDDLPLAQHRFYQRTWDAYQFACSLDTTAAIEAQ